MDFVSADKNTSSQHNYPYTVFTKWIPFYATTSHIKGELTRKSSKAICCCNLIKCFHEHACEIFPHSELKWPSYTLPNMGNRASSVSAVFLPTHCCDVMSEHAVKRVCVVVHCQKPSALIEFYAASAAVLFVQLRFFFKACGLLVFALVVKWNLFVFWVCFLQISVLRIAFFSNFMALLLFQFTAKGILGVFLWKFPHFGLVFRICLPAFLFNFFADFFVLLNFHANGCWACFSVKLPVFGLFFKFTCLFLQNNLASLISSDLRCTALWQVLHSQKSKVESKEYCLYIFCQEMTTFYRRCFLLFTRPSLTCKPHRV